MMCFKMVRLLRLFPIALLFTAADSPAFGAAGWPQAFGTADAPAAETAPTAPLAPSRRLGVDLRAVPQVALGALDVQALLREDAARARHEQTKVLRFGVGRAVRAAAGDGDWHTLPDGGRLWVLDVVSPGALGLRLHFSGLRLPRAAEIAVYAPDDPAHAALYAGDQPSLPGELWTPTTTGERARLEVRLPPRSGDRLPFTLDRLQHLYVDPVARVTGKEAGPCHNDVTCHPEWADVARAVGGLGVILQGDSLFCTGQLLDTLRADRTPYFLTANHCLSSASEAVGAEVFWLYQTATCGGPAPSLASVPRSERTTLLSTGAASDYTLLMVEGALPRGLFWAGWTAAPVPDGTPSAAIHHPAGDFKRISFGDRAHDPVCGGTDEDHLRINWTDGPTEAGSSGSGIFRDDTHQLYGQLHCGPSACGQETNDSFGAFTATYPNIARFLNAGRDDSLEDADSCETARRAAPGTYRNLIVKSTDPDWYRLNVGAGKTLTVTLTFTRAWGNIGARLYSRCDRAPIGVFSGPGNTERITFINPGTAPFMVRWQVFLRNDTRNSYEMTVDVR
jgi:hypothetical protein